MGLLFSSSFSNIKWARRDDNRRRPCVTSTLSERTNERRTQLSFVSLLQGCRSSRAYIGFLSFLFLFFFSFLWFVKELLSLDKNRAMSLQPDSKNKASRSASAPPGTSGAGSSSEKLKDKCRLMWIYTFVPQTPPPSTIFPHYKHTHTSTHLINVLYYIINKTELLNSIPNGLRTSKFRL